MDTPHSQVLTTLRYVADLPLYKIEALYELHMDDEDIPPDAIKTNVKWQPYAEIELRDMRTYPNVGLDETGFTWTSHTSQTLPRFHNIDKGGHRMTADQELISAYLQETADLVKKLTASEMVIAWDWRVGITSRFV